MSLLINMFRSEEDRKLDELLKNHPNPDMHVVGDGTVVTDPDKIRQSEEYKAFVAQMQDFLKTI